MSCAFAYMPIWRTWIPWARRCQTSEGNTQQLTGLTRFPSIPHVHHLKNSDIHAPTREDTANCRTEKELHFVRILQVKLHSAAAGSPDQFCANAPGQAADCPNTWAPTHIWETQIKLQAPTSAWCSLSSSHRAHLWSEPGVGTSLSLHCCPSK